ncbi:MAG TPA: ribosome small subunit-dependent GTPase A [Longimicrobiales bacterium]|nr:ribosome small subunit-dependent GTPase A [Longimicrobiales bacterium]
MTSSGSGRLHGLVRTATGGVYEVELHPGGVVEAVLRGRLKREQRTGDAVVVGDRVLVDRQEDGKHTIEGVEPRRTELARRAPGSGGRRAKVVVANVDQLVAVFALARPAPRLRLLDRFLVVAESSGMEAVIVANKTDLADPARAAAGIDPEEARATQAGLEGYAALGYQVLRTSVTEGEGLEELRARVCGRVTVFAGPSGAGKSSLLNALQPGLALRTAEVSEAVGKGRHTTVSSRLIPLDCGGYVADTPGLRELGLWGVEPGDLDQCFPEFRPYLGQCRFSRSCTHTHEPDCAIAGAVEAGRVSGARLESYRKLLAGDDAR